MLELLKRLHLKVEKFFEARRREASFGKAVFSLLLVALFAGLFYVFVSVGRSDFGFVLALFSFNLFEFVLLLAYGCMVFSAFVLSRCLLFFFGGRKLGGKCSFSQMLLMTVALFVLVIIIAVIVLVASFGALSFWSEFSPLVSVLVVLFLLPLVLEFFMFYAEVVMLKQALNVSFGKAFVLSMVVTMLFAVFASALLFTGSPVLLKPESFSKISSNSDGSFEVSYLTFKGTCKAAFPSGWKIADARETDALMQAFATETVNPVKNTVFYKGVSPAVSVNETQQALYFWRIASDYYNQDVSYYCQSLNATLRKSSNVSIDYVSFSNASGFVECQAQFKGVNTSVINIASASFNNRVGYSLVYVSEEGNADFQHVKNSLYCTRR